MTKRSFHFSWPPTWRKRCTGYDKGLSRLFSKRRPAYPANLSCSAKAFVGLGASPVWHRDKLHFYVLSHRTCQGPIRFLRKNCYIPEQGL